MKKLLVKAAWVLSSALALTMSAQAAGILSHLKVNDLFREFRQGDVALERWDRMESTGDRLRQALGFLYY